MSRLLDSALDAERLLDVLAHDARPAALLHPAALHFDSAEAALRAGRRAFAHGWMLDAQDYVELARSYLADALTAIALPAIGSPA